METKFEFERVSPGEAGVSEKGIGDFLKRLEEGRIDLHSMMLLRHGKVCAELWRAPHSPEELHAMHSFSKSLTSTAIGFAVQEGLMSLEERLVDLFPDRLPQKVSAHLEKATVRDLLIMGCGHATEPDGQNQPDWIDRFLAHDFVYEPGTMFQYNTMGTNMLSAALLRKTGEGLTQFLRPRLLDRLGIGEVEISVLPDGVENGGAGYRLRTEDMARFITFVANRGRWQNEQLLNAAWFDAACSKQIETSNGVFENKSPDWQEGYGYQFWRCRPEGVFRADGMGGQFGIIMPDRDAVLILTEMTSDMQFVLQAVWDILLPAME
ncbi:MAG: serine hydrolase [Eubacteriales bacterium]|nr:serine hydrolase [Eubacteriales bacterium]